MHHGDVLAVLLRRARDEVREQVEARPVLDDLLAGIWIDCFTLDELGSHVCHVCVAVVAVQVAQTHLEAVVAADVLVQPVRVHAVLRVDVSNITITVITTDPGAP